MLIIKLIRNACSVCSCKNSCLEIGSRLLFSSSAHNRASRKAIAGRSRCVVLTDDESTFVCWHPEQPFPYEHTKPLPRFEPELQEGDSALKVQYRLEHKHRFRPTGPTDEELQQLTFTTKHQWFPNSKKKYKIPNPPRDREGI